MGQCCIDQQQLDVAVTKHSIVSKPKRFVDYESTQLGVSDRGDYSNYAPTPRKFRSSSFDKSDGIKTPRLAKSTSQRLPRFDGS